MSGNHRDSLNDLDRGRLETLLFWTIASEDEPSRATTTGSSRLNLVRGLQKEIDDESDAAPELQSLRDRAERILKDLESRNTTGLAAMDLLAAMAKEKEAAIKAAKDSGLSPRAFGVYWTLKDDAALGAAGISALELALEAETQLARFPNARVNADEQRRLRAALYRPLLDLGKQERGRVVDAVLAILLDGEADAEA